MSEFLILPSTSTFQEQDESYKWNHNTTLIFLDLYKDYRKQVGSLRMRNLKRMFDEIAKELRHKTKQNITAANCENRWKHLERTYKKFIDNNNKTGRGRKDFEYAEIMDEILGNKRNIHPAILLSSDTVNAMEAKNTGLDNTNLEKENITRDIIEENKTVQITEVASVKTSYKSRKLRTDVLKEIRQDRKDFYKKLLELEEKKLLEKQRKNKILEERNTVLKQYMLKELPVVHMEDA